MGVTHNGTIRFRSIYAHLSKTFVSLHEPVRRGQLIGLSGTGMTPPWDHLHFGIVKPGGNWLRYSHTYDPNGFWLGGKPECFIRDRDYSRRRADEISFPVACPEYQSYLTNEGKIPDTDTAGPGCNEGLP